MKDEDNSSNSVNDLSAGIVKTDVLSGIVKEQQQKQKFRNFSFYATWGVSICFFVMVFFLSAKVLFYPSVFFAYEKKVQMQVHLKPQQTQTGNPSSPTQDKLSNSATDSSSSIKILPNQYLILLALLSAVGTSLAIAVIRFSFSDESEKNQDKDSVAISPAIEAISNLLKQLIDLIKQK